MLVRTYTPICALALLSACSGTAVTPSGDKEPSAPTEKPVACATDPGVTQLLEVPVASQPAADGTDVILSIGQALIRVPVAGGDSTTIAEAQDASAPVVLGSSAYFSAEMLGTVDANGKQSSTPGVFSVPLDGGAPSAIATLGNFSPLVGDDSALYVDAHDGLKRWDPATDELSDLSVPAALSVDATAVHGEYVYVAAQDIKMGGFTNGVIGRIPKLGGSLEVLVQGLGHPWNLVACEAGLYWNEDPPALYGAGTGRVGKSTLEGAAVSTVVQREATSLAFARGRLFAALGSEIDSFDADGGDKVVLARGLDDAGMLEIVGGNVVWIDPFTKAKSSTAPTHLMTACASP